MYQRPMKDDSQLFPIGSLEDNVFRFHSQFLMEYQLPFEQRTYVWPEKVDLIFDTSDNAQVHTLFDRFISWLVAVW